MKYIDVKLASSCFQIFLNAVLIVCLTCQDHTILSRTASQLVLKNIFKDYTN